MWKEKLEEIIQEKTLYGEKVNSGALEKEIINGIEYNSFMIYGIDEGLLEESPNQHINGLIELN